MAMGKRIPTSPKAPATSQRVRGRLRERFSTAATVSTVRLSGFTRQVQAEIVLGRPALSDDHDFGRFDERRRSLTHFQAQVSRGVARNDGGDALSADVEQDLGQKTDRFELGDAPHQLISPADQVLEPGPRRAHPGSTPRQPDLARAAADPRAPAKQHAVNLRARNTVMAARCLHRPDLSLVDPLLESRIAHSQFARGLAQVNKFHESHASARPLNTIPDPKSTRFNSDTQGSCREGAVIWDGTLSKTESVPRKRESTPQTLGHALSTDWIPAFAGTTVARACLANDTS